MPIGAMFHPALMLFRASSATKNRVRITTLCRKFCPTLFTDMGARNIGLSPLLTLLFEVRFVTAIRTTIFFVGKVRHKGFPAIRTLFMVQRWRWLLFLRMRKRICGVPALRGAIFHSECIGSPERFSTVLACVILFSGLVRPFSGAFRRAAFLARVLCDKHAPTNNADAFSFHDGLHSGASDHRPRR